MADIEIQPTKRVQPTIAHDGEKSEPEPEVETEESDDEYLDMLTYYQQLSRSSRIMEQQRKAKKRASVALSSFYTSDEPTLEEAL